VDFIEKAQIIHGQKYNYSKVYYINSYTKLNIICPVHGLFEQSANSHLSGHGCPKCSKFTHDKEINLLRFIDKSITLHGNKYDYSKVDYINGKTDVIIICPKHGEFKQRPNHHKSGSGCLLCSQEKRLKRNQKEKELEFLKKAENIHGDKYDYSKIEFINSKKEVSIICPEHGEFQQKPNNHINLKHGCPSCGKRKGELSRTLNNDIFIKKSRKIHGNKYDYTEINYTNNRDRLLIICHKHGRFLQTAMTHMAGRGCPKCSYNGWNVNEFIDLAKEIHCDKYDYSNVNYTNCNTPVTIVCHQHGQFKQRPYHHIHGSGCPQCGLSIIQNQVYHYVLSICDEETKLNDRKIINPYELDIVVPSRNFAIEVNGLFWHSFDILENKKQKLKHQDKMLKCFKNNINLFTIWEHQWYYNKSIIKSMISGKLANNISIFARKCEAINITSRDFNEFLDNNHLQGGHNSSVRLGLLHDNDLVCVLGLIKNKKYEWEISRFASKKFNNVVGGFSKLLKYFRKIAKPSCIMSYANMDHSNGNLYRKNGFSLDGITNPGYFYYKRNSILSRQQCQKHKLKEHLAEFDNNLSESENMFNNGYRRVWNCGNMRFIKSIK